MLMIRKIQALPQCCIIINQSSDIYIYICLYLYFSPTREIVVVPVEVVIMSIKI